MPKATKLVTVVETQIHEDLVHAHPTQAVAILRSAHTEPRAESKAQATIPILQREALLSLEVLHCFLILCLRYS